jgi:uncharacterized protein DUF4325
MSTRAREIVITLKPLTGDFAEDKDAAATIRERQVRRALDAGEHLVFDFKGVRVATQSFVHALISDVLRSRGEAVLDRIDFKNCTTAVKGIIQTVVQYSLESVEMGAVVSKREAIDSKRRSSSSEKKVTKDTLRRPRK